MIKMKAFGHIWASASGAPVRLMLLFMSLSLAYLALDPWHNWGGDFAYYLRVARNMYFDRPLDAGTVGVVAPSGFPWLLSKLAPLLDWRFTPLKRLNLVYATVYFGLIFFLSGKFQTSFQRVAFAAVGSLNLWVWSYSNQILTEMPMLMIVTGMFAACIWSEERKERFPWRLMFTLYLLALAACSLKQAALLTLFVPPLIFLDRKSNLSLKPKIAIFLVLVALSTAIVLYVFHSQWFHAQAHTARAQGSSGLLGKLIFMLGKVDDELKALSAMLLGDVRLLWTGGVLAAVIAIAAVKRILEGRLAAIALVASLSVPLFYVPWTPFDGRYWFPMLGALCFLIVEGATTIAARIGYRVKKPAESIFLVALLVSLSVHNVGNAKRLFLIDRDKGVFEINASEMFYWVHYNTEWGKRICFYKPRILGYFANWNTVCDLNRYGKPSELEAVLETRADFIIVSDKYAPETWSYFRDLSDNRVVYRNEKFVVVGK